MSEAFHLFENTLKRSRNMFMSSLFLSQAEEDLSKIKTVAQEEYNKDTGVADIGRASIVTAVAAFDFYFTNRFSECVIPILKNKKQSKNLVSLLEEVGLDVSTSLELLSSNSPYKKIRDLIERHYENHVTQRFASIDNLFINIGIKDFCENVEKKSDKNNLNASVEKLIKRRHAIVHTGDLNKQGDLNPLDPEDMEEKINYLEEFVQNSEVIIFRRMKSI